MSHSGMDPATRRWHGHMALVGTSLLMVVADHDNIAVTDAALALAPKRLVMIKGGHFDPYLGAALDWFRAHLASPGLAA